jgi:hypothetical protein
MRTGLIALSLVVFACGSSKSDDKSGNKTDDSSKAGSGEAKPADTKAGKVVDKGTEPAAGDKAADPPTVKHSACIDPWKPDGEMPMASHAEVAGDVATLCLASDDTVCYAINLTSGQYDKGKAWDPNPEDLPVPRFYPLVAPASKVEVHVQQREETFELCDTTGQCRALLPSVADERALYGHIDGVGTTGVLTVVDGDEKHYAEVFDRQTNHKKRFPIGTGDWICGEAYSLGDVVLAMMNNCAGPAGVSFLYQPTGELIGQIGGDRFGTNGASAIQVSSTQWAFNEESGTSVVVVDVTTGKSVHTVDLASLYPKDADGAPMLADPDTSVMVRGPNGTVAVLYGGVMIGHAIVIDAAAGKIANKWEPPACTKG